MESYARGTSDVSRASTRSNQSGAFSSLRREEYMGGKNRDESGVQENSCQHDHGGNTAEQW